MGPRTWRLSAGHARPKGRGVRLAHPNGCLGLGQPPTDADRLPMPTLLTLPTLLLLLPTPKTTMLLLLLMLLMLLLLPRAATLACYSSTPLFRRWFQA